jgi:uncharacterized protein (TIGR03437 family)
LKFVISALVSVSAILTPAVAAVANFGPTNQSVTLTGLGGNAVGDGQVRATWGSCTFDGKNSVCTVSAPFTGVGPGGTISFVLTYAGNGPSPLTAVSQSPGNDQLGPFSLSSGSFVTTITESDGTTLIYDGEAPYMQYNQPGDAPAQCTLVSSCSVGQVGLAFGATITGQVSGSFDPTPVIRTLSSLSGYGGFSAIAPATWIEIHGANLATYPTARQWAAADFNGNTGPTQLGTTSVSIGGQQAFIEYISPVQINAQVPSNVALGQQPVVVTTAGGSSLPYNVQVNPIQPGLLAPSVFQVGGLQYVDSLFGDGVTYVLPPGITNAVPNRRAKPNDTIVLFGIGFGPVTPNFAAGQIVQQTNTLQTPIQVFFGGTPAQVAYQGLGASFLGLYQINVVVPNIAANDAVPLTFSLGSVKSSQSLVIAIGN